MTVAGAAKRRVLVVSHYPVFGGPHNVAMRVNAALTGTGWEIRMLVPEGPGNAVERLRAGGVCVYRLPLHRLRKGVDPRGQAAFVAKLPSEVAGIRRLLREEAIDVLLLGGYLNPHGAIAARLEGVPIVWQVANVHTFSVLRPALIRMIESFADAIMFTSERLRQVYMGERASRVRVFPFYPPVDTRLFFSSEAKRRETRRRLGIPDDAPVVGTVGNVTPQKGMEYFFQAAQIILSSHPDCRFLIVGDNTSHRDYNEKILAQIQRLELSPERLIFTGALPDVENYYPAMDIKLITSLWEGVPTAVLEAMASGLPVVTTDVGGLREVVGDGERGFVVPSRDPAASAAAALRLLDNDRLRREMAQRARRHAVEHFDVAICAEVHRQAFEAAIEHRTVRES